VATGKPNKSEEIENKQLSHSDEDPRTCAVNIEVVYHGKYERQSFSFAESLMEIRSLCRV
jgi:hypothetical protein